MVCKICSAKKGRSYDFCWQCEEEWSGPTTSSVKCGNSNCEHPELPAVRNCPLIKLEDTTLPEIPSRRACPTCGKVSEHTGKKCKNVICPRCNVEFCFACLETTAECIKKAPGSWFRACAKGVAPRQTSIPVWSRTQT